MRPIYGVFAVLLIAGRISSPVTATQASREKLSAMAVIRFKGTPQGGQLSLWVKGRIVRIMTRPGEDLAEIANDAARQINGEAEMKEQGITARGQGREVRIHTNEAWVFLCAGDTGLDVPPPPTDLRVQKGEDGLIHLTWKVPHGGFDRIHILRGTLPIADGIDGANTTFADYAPGERMTYRVFGIKDGTPSCAATF